MPPPLQTLDSALTTFLSGFSYGVSVRLPHSLLHAFLFGVLPAVRRQGGGSDDGKGGGVGGHLLREAGNATWEHARTLGTFGFFYKMSMGILSGVRQCRRRRGGGGGGGGGGSIVFPSTLDPLVAGGLGGYLVWGSRTRVNEQVVMYLIGRVVFGLVKIWRAGAEGRGGGKGGRAVGKRDRENDYRVVSTVVWALSMWMYEERREVLPGGMRRSMEEIYR